MSLLENFYLRNDIKSRSFKLNSKSYTISMKTLNIRELFRLLTITEGELFGVFLHKLYENNRDIIIDNEFKTYIFSQMGWDIENKTHKDKFTKLIKSLDKKDVLTKVQHDRLVINPFVSMVGGVDNFISTTIKYYLSIRVKRGIYSKSMSGYVYDIFEKNYKTEIKTIISNLNQEDDSSQV